MDKFVKVRETVFFDDLIEYGFDKPLRVINNEITQKIDLIGKGVGLKFETFYSPQHEKFVVFATNGKGFRFIFMFVEEWDGRFKSLNSTVVTDIQRVLYLNQNTKRYFKELREANIRRRALLDENDKKEFDYYCGHNQRLFRSLSRALGYTHGKVRLPV